MQDGVQEDLDNFLVMLPASNQRVTGRLQHNQDNKR